MSNLIDWPVAFFGAAALMAAAAFVASIAIDLVKKRRLSRTSAVFSVAVLIVMFLGWWDQNQTRAERHSDQQKIDQLTSNLADARREQSGIQRTLEDEVEAAKREREAAEARAERLTLELSATRATLEGEVEAATLEREFAQDRAQRLELELSETRTTLEGEVEAATREREAAEARAERLALELSSTRATLEDEVEAATLERERAQARAQRLELELSETRATLEGEVEAATRERLLAEARAEAANSEADRSREILENVIAGLDRTQALSEESLRSVRGAQAESARQREFAEAQAFCSSAPWLINGERPSYGRYVCNCREAVLPDQVTSFCTNTSGWGSSGGWSWND